MLRISVVDRKVFSPRKRNNSNLYIYELALSYICRITRINKEHFELNTRHDHVKISLWLSRLVIFQYNELAFKLQQTKPATDLSEAHNHLT